MDAEAHEISKAGENKKPRPPFPTVEMVGDKSLPPQASLPKTETKRKTPPGWKPTTAIDPEEEDTAAELGPQAENILIPLKGIWDYYYKHVPSEPTLDPSQTLGWNVNGHPEDIQKVVQPDIEAKEDLKEIGKDTQEDLDTVDEIMRKMEIRRRKMKKEEEERADKIRKELEDMVRKQREGINQEGRKI